MKDVSCLVLFVRVVRSDSRRVDAAKSSIGISKPKGRFVVGEFAVENGLKVSPPVDALDEVVGSPVGL